MTRTPEQQFVWALNQARTLDEVEGAVLGRQAIGMPLTPLEGEALALRRVEILAAEVRRA